MPANGVRKLDTAYTPYLYDPPISGRLPSAPFTVISLVRNLLRHFAPQAQILPAHQARVPEVAPLKLAPRRPSSPPLRSSLPHPQDLEVLGRS